MDVGEHIDALDREGRLLATAAVTAGPWADVPSCPGWSVRDLVRHTGGVHRWASGVVATPHTEPWDVELAEVVGEWPPDQDLLAWFADGHRGLVNVLRSAAPDLACWTFLRAPSPLAMWSRRQAHETAIHRADAELAAVLPVTGYDAPFAADGIDELLTCFITRKGGRLRANPARNLRVRCTDADGDWMVQIGPDDAVTTLPDGAGEADCQVSGPATALYLTLWNRGPAGPITVDGDGTVLEVFRDRVQVRWA